MRTLSSKTQEINIQKKGCLFPCWWAFVLSRAGLLHFWVNEDAMRKKMSSIGELQVCKSVDQRGKPVNIARIVKHQH